MNLQAERRAALKQSTDGLHRKVDAAIAQQAPLDQIDGYARFLCCMADVHDRFGPLSDRCSEAASIEAHSPRLVNFLSADLAALGVAREAEPEPAATNLSPWGVAYALEGSALGSTQLLKLVRSLHGEAAPATFLSASAQGAHERWPVFLNALGRAEVDIEAASEAAQAVFEYILERLPRTVTKPTPGASVE